MNWLLLLVFVFVILIVLSSIVKKKEVSEVLASEDTLRKYIHHMRKQLGLPSSVIDEDDEDRIVKRLQREWSELMTLMIKIAMSSGKEKNELTSIVERLDADFDERLIEMLPKDFANAWRKQSPEQIEKCGEDFWNEIAAQFK